MPNMLDRNGRYRMQVHVSTSSRTTASSLGKRARPLIASASDAIIRQANAQLAALKPRIEENKGKVGNVEMGASKNLSFA
ncbi:MAG: hypothetical protein ACO3JG_08195 [Luteolibacter sp.]